MVSPEALKLNEILRDAPKAVDMNLTHQRDAGEHAEDMTSEPEGVAFAEARAVDGLWATPRSWNGESAIMYLYGGGYLISAPHSRRKLAGHLANASPLYADLSGLPPLLVVVYLSSFGRHLICRACSLLRM